MPGNPQGRILIREEEIKKTDGLILDEELKLEAF